MSSDTDARYTHSYRPGEDGALHFACATDVERWPWLALPPFDPIVAQTLCYYASYEPAVHRGMYAAGQWTALTWTDWTCGEAGAGHAVRGVSHAARDGSGGFRLEFHDRDGALVYRMNGGGVVFRNRDFESWRREQKRELGPAYDPADFEFVAPDRVGMCSARECFLSPLQGETDVTALALVTAQSGFPPRHPYHDGSGDHVNAGHLADVARQFLRLVENDPGLQVIAGEMQFRRYVELDHPLVLRLVRDESDDAGSAVEVRQAGTLCSMIRLRMARA